MNVYTLVKDGDIFEQHYWPIFIGKEFAVYEAFWQKHVVPLTNRPGNIDFKNDTALRSTGKTHQDICIAQLHYSILRHLARLFELMTKPKIVDLDCLTDGFARLTGAHDVAFELLERYCSRTKYNPWDEKDGRQARSTWQKMNSYPLQLIRDYRNHLIHGRLTPSVIGGDHYFPRIGLEKKYLDWRSVTQNPSLNSADFDTGRNILNAAWSDTLDYLENSWKGNLL